MHAQTSSPESWRSALSRFFFAEETPYGLAIIRIVLPWVLICDAVYRWPLTRELYSTDGAPTPLGDNFGVPAFLPEPSGPVAVALHTAMIFLLVTSSLGWCARISLFGSLALYFYFGFLDCISTLTKYNVIAMHVLLLLAVSEGGRIWSVDGWLKRTPGSTLPPPAFAIWPQRLMQILLAMIYFGAGVTKLHTPAFFSGDQLMYWMITYVNNAHPLGDYLAQFPMVLVLFAYITIIWELAFPMLVLQKWGRVPVLLVGAFFHVMTAFTLGLIIFPMVMITTYMAFLTDKDLLTVRRALQVRRWRMPSLGGARWLTSLAAWRPRTRWAATAAFGLLLTLVMLGGVQAEQMLDVYKLNGPGGPLPLKELPAEEVQRLFTPPRPLREIDKFQAVDLGSGLLGEHLLHRRSSFQQNEEVIVQVSLNPPHEDLWLECLVLDADGHILTRAGQITTRETFRANFLYMFDGSYQPGEYTFQIKSSNQEVFRKSFSLLPGAKKD